MTEKGGGAHILEVKESCAFQVPKQAVKEANEEKSIVKNEISAPSITKDASKEAIGPKEGGRAGKPTTKKRGKEKFQMNGKEQAIQGDINHINIKNEDIAKEKGLKMKERLKKGRRLRWIRGKELSIFHSSLKA